MNLQNQIDKKSLLSVVIPCFNEGATLGACIDRTLALEDESLAVEVIVVDDGSTDNSFDVAKSYRSGRQNVTALRHEKNRGKGAGLRTGIARAKGDFVAVLDADMEYDPAELKRLIAPLVNNRADVVFGSRFLTTDQHRVLYFWHSVGNRLLTFLSNALSDLNLTDMETGYKIFRRQIIQSITIEEDRFGFEPEIVAKVAQMRLRIFEMGISYDGRTYTEGKKIGIKDGYRALYCIGKYNLPKAAWPVQLFFYLGIAAMAGLVNLGLFLLCIASGIPFTGAAFTAYMGASIVDYFLCIGILFRHKARWSSPIELVLFWLVAAVLAVAEPAAARVLFVMYGCSLTKAIIAAFVCTAPFNFIARRLIVFHEHSSKDWKSRIDINYGE